ncbi:MAG: GNAT family N-acetyltransferase [Phycisphaerales bacterium]|nr:MAG: GNAT family N-acetyltransferase [Phycisphaerales bacterium]
MQGYPKVVKLKDGRNVTLRLLANGDFEKLYAFFQDLEEADRLFLRDNVADPALIRKWTENIDCERVVPIVAEDGETIVADATLHNRPHGWAQHVGLIRLVVAGSHRDVGLGTLLARELVGLAEERGLEKLQANVIEDDQAMLKTFEAMGFGKEAVVREAVKDQHGNKHNLAILINDVADLGRSLEDWISDTMIPSFRVPGAGA